MGFFTFKTQPSGFTPSLPQLTSSVALTPMGTKRRRRRRIYSCSLCTRGSLAGVGYNWRDRVISVGGKGGHGKGVSIRVSLPAYSQASVHF